MMEQSDMADGEGKQDRFAKWVARHAVEDLRSGREISDDVIDELCKREYWDAMRELLTSADMSMIRRLLNNSNWRLRYLGLGISRPLVDSELTNELRAMFDREDHLRPKLSIIHTLCGLDAATPEDKKKYLEWISDERYRMGFAEVQSDYFGEGTNDRSVVTDNLIKRLHDPAFQGSRFLRVYALGFIGGATVIPIIEGYTNDDESVTARAAKLALDYLSGSE